MAELYNNKRVKFLKGNQKKFILAIIENQGLNYLKLATKIGANPRTLNDWINEKSTLPLLALQKLSRMTPEGTPPNLKILDRYWYSLKGAKAGGYASYKKQGNSIGNSEVRRQKWLEWWTKKGQYIKKKILLPRNIRLPSKNRELAELIGIILGDGAITKYQLVITLNSTDDLKYSKFVIKLITKLFSVRPSINLRPKYSVIIIVCSRIKIISFCQKIGLKLGNKVKQQVDIPQWIMLKKNLQTACARGLMDTDGCIYEECHTIKNKKYCYPRLAFVNHSIPLLNSLYSILKKLGFNPKHRNNRSVHLENKGDIINYFKKVGTSNPKHRLRFERYIN